MAYLAYWVNWAKLKKTVTNVIYKAAIKTSTPLLQR